MIVTINSVYKDTLEELKRSEGILDSTAVSDLNRLADDLKLKEDVKELASLHNNLLKLRRAVDSVNGRKFHNYED